MTYVLIDLENVMPDDFSRLNREDVRTGGRVGWGLWSDC